MSHEGSNVADDIKADRIEAEVKISTRRIELVDDQGNLTAVLDGGEETENGRKGLAGLTLYGAEGPEGPEAAATIVMDRETGQPTVYLYTENGGGILLHIDERGRAVVQLTNEDGSGGQMSWPGTDG